MRSLGRQASYVTSGEWDVVFTFDVAERKIYGFKQYERTMDLRLQDSEYS